MRLADVPIEVPRLCVTSVTVLALKGTLARVHDGVAPQCVRAREGLSAHVAGGDVFHVVAHGILEVLEVGLLVGVGVRGREHGVLGGRGQGEGEGLRVRHVEQAVGMFRGKVASPDGWHLSSGILIL